MSKEIVDTKVDEEKLAQLLQVMSESAELTMRQIQTDLISAQTIPFDTGTLQTSHFVDMELSQVAGDNGAVAVAILATGLDVPYARYVYYHPEFNFQTVNNPNAQALWFETYIDGEKAGMIEEIYQKICAMKLRRIGMGGGDNG